MKDVYLMDNDTGELIPAEEAIRSFYKDHGIMEAWTDYYTETGIETETEISAPDFTRVFN